MGKSFKMAEAAWHADRQRKNAAYEAARDRVWAIFSESSTETRKQLFEMMRACWCLRCGMTREECPEECGR